MKATWLSGQQWYNRLKSIETRNRKQYGCTYTVPTIERDLRDCIIETDTEGNIRIDYDRYKELRKTAGVMPERFDTMVDRNGNSINKGDEVNVIIDGELHEKGTFLWATSELATVREHKNRGIGLNCAHQSLKQYVYKSDIA